MDLAENHRRSKDLPGLDLGLERGKIEVENICLERNFSSSIQQVIFLGLGSPVQEGAVVGVYCLTLRRIYGTGVLRWTPSFSVNDLDRMLRLDKWDGFRVISRRHDVRGTSFRIITDLSLGAMGNGLSC